MNVDAGPSAFPWTFTPSSSLASKFSGEASIESSLTLKPLTAIRPLTSRVPLVPQSIQLTVRSKPLALVFVANRTGSETLLVRSIDTDLLKSIVGRKLSKKPLLRRAEAGSCTLPKSRSKVFATFFHTAFLASRVAVKVASS